MRIVDFGRFGRGAAGVSEPTSWSTASTSAGSVTSNVWTPGRDANGYITQASINALPANTWVQVADTEWSVLEALVTASGFSPYTSFDFGTNKTIRSTFYSWVGACDDGRRVYYPRGGGHVDSSVNGVYALDLLKMGWEVVKQPSKYNESGFAWSSRYAKSSPDTSSFTRYIDESGVSTDPDGLYQDMLPDGTPTSAHVYDGVWFDSSRNEIGTTRISKWVYDRDANEWARTRWTWNGAAAAITTINANIHYHAGNDALYGCLGRVDGGDTSFGKCPGGTAAWVSLTGPGSGWVNFGMCSVRLDADRVLWQWGVYGVQRWAIYNMSTETWEGVGFTTDTKAITFASEMMGAIYIPTWGDEGQIIMRGTADGLSGQWWAFDIATKANVTYSPTGSVPGSVLWPGSKYRSIPALGIAMALNDASGSNATRAVHVMRYE